MSNTYKEYKFIDLNAFSGSSENFRTANGGYWSIVSSSAQGENVDFESFNPTHPSGNYAPFIKATLRGIASGLGVSYNSLASDLEGVNFSSIRTGVLEERQHWKVIQSWMIEHFCQPIYVEWLKFAIISKQLAPIPMNKLGKFIEPKWQPRGFHWIDPLKDAKANLEELKMGVKSRSDILAEKGKDIEEVFNQIKNEEDLAVSVGININSVPITEEPEPVTEE